MRDMLFQSKSKTFSKEAMWNRMITLEDYPKWWKFCKSVTYTEIKEGAIYYDVTTLLWIPIKIKHIVTKIKPYEELGLFLTLPFVGRMWFTLDFKQQGKDAMMNTEIKFDLGNKFYNATVGYVLEKRWEDLMLNIFTTDEEIKRLQ